MALTRKNEEKLLKEQLIPYLASFPRAAEGKAISRFFNRIAGQSYPFYSKEEAALFSFYSNPALPNDDPTAIQTFIREYLFDQDFPTALQPLDLRRGRNQLANWIPTQATLFFGNNERQLLYTLIPLESRALPAAFTNAQNSQCLVFKSLYHALEAAREYPTLPSIWLTSLRANEQEWKWNTRLITYSFRQKLFSASITCALIPANLLFPLVGGLMESDGLHHYVLPKTYINKPEEPTRKRTCAIV